MPRGRRPSNKISVDFTDVEAGSLSIDDGKYQAEVVSVAKETSSSGNDYLAWKLKVYDDDTPLGTVYDNMSLQPQALWKLKGMLIALGIDVPDGEMELDMNEPVGLPVTVEIVNEEWEGKSVPRIAAYGVASDEEEEEKPAPKRGRGRPPKKTEEEEKPTPKRGRGRPRKTETEDETEEKPAPKRRGRKKKPTVDVGTLVDFDDEGEEFQGEVMEISEDGKTAIVSVDDDEEWEVAINELKPTQE